MHFLTPNDTADVGEGKAIPFVRLYLVKLLEEVRDGLKVQSSKPLEVRFYRTSRGAEMLSDWGARTTPRDRELRPMRSGTLGSSNFHLTCRTT